jgi:heat shock protein 4
MDKMDAECASSSGSSDMVANGVEDSSYTQSKSSHDSANVLREDKVTRRLEIPVSVNIYGGMTKDELSEAQEKEIQLTQQDRAVELTKDRKNALESYVYDMRNKLFNTYRSFASDQEREGISRNLQQTEEWLYDDGDDETENAYTSKLEDLKKLVDPIDNRYKDEEARAQATRDLLKSIVDYRMSVDSIPPKDREMITNECNKAEHWLREKSQLQDSMPKNADPVLWSADIKSRKEDLDMTCKHILRSKASPPNLEDQGPDQHNTSSHT